MGPDSYGFTRALFGLVVSGVLGVAVTCFTKPQPYARIIGLVNGTQLDAMRLFKGAEINRRPGRNAQVEVIEDSSLAEEGEALLPQSALDTMAAEPGDIIYVCDRRWWLGGLRSVHTRIKGVSPDDKLRLSPLDAASAHFRGATRAYAEKIC